jgi:hypothetical protein
MWPSASRRNIPSSRLVAAVAASVLAIFVGAAGGKTDVASAAPMDNNAKRACVYSALQTSILQDFSAMVGRQFGCAVVFNDSMPDWTGWERPWFTTYKDPNYAWHTWTTAPGSGRQLIISQSLIPQSLTGTDWRTAGARGDFNDHAQALARNLIAAGLGDSVIRFAGEANGTWNRDNIGSTDQDFELWRQYWRQAVLAMRSVPGANFRFDWTVNAAVRPIPLDKWYPGDDVVDIVGIDAYDSGFGNLEAGPKRWDAIYNQPIGIADVLRFAQAHSKPLSIPEWGVAPTQTLNSAGDDPWYVDGIASVVRNNEVAYQSYFYKGDFGAQLANGPLSLAAYRGHFGANGDSLGPADGAPALDVTGGPRDGSQIGTVDTTFTFTAQPETTLTCKLDRAATRSCTGAGRDSLTGLGPGSHDWTVQARTPSGSAAKRTRSFQVSRAAALRRARIAMRGVVRSLKRVMVRHPRRSRWLATKAPMPGKLCVLVAARSKRARTIRCGRAKVRIRAGRTLAWGSRSVRAAGRTRVHLRSKRGIGRRAQAAAARRATLVSIFVPARTRSAATQVRHSRARVAR